MLGMDHDRDDFRRLMQRLQDGSEEAARELVERFGDALRRAIRRALKPRLRSMFDSADFAQRVWLSFFRHRELARGLNDPEELVALLMTMANTKVAAEVRDRLVRRKHNLNRERSLEQSMEDAREIPDGRAPAVESLVEQEQLERFLAGQPEQHRRMVQLRLQGLGNREIAERVGLAQSTVWRFWKKLVNKLGWLARP